MSLVATLFHVIAASGYHGLTSKHVSKKIMKEKEMDHTEIPFHLQDVKGIEKFHSP